MASATVTALPTSRQSRKVAPVKARKPSLRDRLTVVSGAAIGAIAIAATTLLLSDLAESIEQVAHVAAWKSYALGIALDANFIAVESFSLFATAAVARSTARATIATKVITLSMSAVANSWAMAHSADGW
jgi:hypothetical protein